MDPAFNDAYENLFSEFPIFYNFRYYDRELFDIPRNFSEESLRQVRNSITEYVNRSLVKPIRPDAKLFLMANYTYMVLLPVLIANRANDLKSPIDEQFRSKIREDIKVIFEEASQVTNDEITSHSIIKAIDNRWSTLFSTSGINWSKRNR